MAWVGGCDMAEETTSEPYCQLASDGCLEQKPLYICNADAHIHVTEVMSLFLF